MGGACSGPKPDPTAKAIEQQLQQDRKNRANELKILLLGAGESGKSTIAKQFRIINLGDYSQEELKEYRVFVYDNTLSSIKCLAQAAETLGIPVGADVQPIAEKFKKMNLGVQKEIDEKLAAEIKLLWADSGIQETFKRSKEYQLNDNAKYVLDNIDRIAAPNYSPSQEDVIHTRVRTTGVIETTFELGKKKLRLVDVGGQRAERRKWMGCFEDVTAVIFCCALSEYDLKLAEDGTTNRMKESLQIFDELCQKWFKKTSIILFLNKKDLFEKKIVISPLKNTFPDYTGPDEYQPAAEFIEQKFIAQDQQDNGPEGRIFPHFTCATDTHHVRAVFDAIKDTLLKAALQSVGLV
eukprot:TRINITY_DN1504_c0_g1_i1.p1 TRINITY_DN1504_c0_g1~~TRINITY_DN1504_c0_g1_i1.p1  ORF type:complete len:352 (-),score=116.04 TRINITY_DN1504_c0_g1_i1:188-1243(-)